MTPKPSGKTGVTTTAGAGAIVLVWLLGEFGIDMPMPVATAVGVVACALIAWIMPARSGKYVHTDDAPKH